MLLVSVIIPVYNDPVGIRKALDSLVAQSLPKECYEIIVVGNNSTDWTHDVVEEYVRRSTHSITLTSERKQSSYAARNQGIRIAKGQILAFTDSDCLPCRDWIEKGCQALQDCRACFAAGRIDVTYELKRLNTWEYFDSARKLNQRAYVENAGFGATANLFVRKELFERHGYFRSDLPSGGDYEFGRRLTKAGEKLVFAEHAVVYHPARSSFRAILRKSKRVAKGQKELQKLGLLEHGVLSVRSLIPIQNGPELEGVALSVSQRLVILLIANFVKYYNIFQRL